VSSTKFDSILNELRELQSDLKTTANRLWNIKLSLAAAIQEGQGEADFLFRRLMKREREEQQEFEKFLNRLNRVISSHLDSSLIAFSSIEDVRTVADISRTIRYLHNSFAGELPLGHTWVKLNAALPAFSRN
jgi:Skp family chaperone for outer membrane proteins